MIRRRFSVPSTTASEGEWRGGSGDGRDGGVWEGVGGVWEGVACEREGTSERRDCVVSSSVKVAQTPPLTVWSGSSVCEVCVCVRVWVRILLV